MNAPSGPSDPSGPSGPSDPDGPRGRPGPRIPPPRVAPDDGVHRGAPVPDGPEPAERAAPAPASVPTPAPAPQPAAPDHRLLKSLLGAWALAACSAEETAAVEDHLTDCAPCADEALRLRDAVGLLHPEDNLDLDPLLRSRVLAGCLGRRPARIPVPDWAGPYDAETARLDALLHDMGEAEWRAPVRLKWFDGQRELTRDATVSGVIGHLMAVDGLVATALGLGDPLGDGTGARMSPADRTEAYWRREPAATPGAVRELWREQTHTLVRTVSFAGRGATGLTVPYGGDLSLPMSDSFLDRAFECWMHAGDIADAVDYPYEPPMSPHLNRMIDLAVRLLPTAQIGRAHV